MIKTKDILYSVRALLKDNNEMTYSDYDIKLALNTALRFISQASLLKNSDFLETSKELTITNVKDGVVLPEDFQALTGVTKDNFSLSPVRTTKEPKEFEYKIMGEKLYTGATNVVIVYKRLILPIANLQEDSVPLPMFCKNLIVETTISILKGVDSNDLIVRMNNIISTDMPLSKYNGKNKQQ